MSSFYDDQTAIKQLKQVEANYQEARKIAVRIVEAISHFAKEAKLRPDIQKESLTGKFVFSGKTFSFYPKFLVARTRPEKSKIFFHFHVDGNEEIQLHSDGLGNIQFFIRGKEYRYQLVTPQGDNALFIHAFASALILSSSIED